MNHLAFAHLTWQNHLASLKKPNPVAFDATAGNGHDTLKLAKLLLTPSSGELHSFDIQKTALLNTQKLLSENLSTPILDRITLHHRSHETFPKILPSPDLVVYNLGYLPGGDKSLTTTLETTLKSLQSALETLPSASGLITITLYPGHPEGAVEKSGVLDYLSSLDPKSHQIFHYTPLKKYNSPSVIVLRKLI